MNSSQGVQCRTMTSQRPCGSSQCTREECAREKLYEKVFSDVLRAPNMCDACGVSQGARDWCEYCGLDTTPPREPLSAPESDERTTEVQEPTYTLQGLSARDVARIEQALRMLRRTFTRDSAGYREISALGAFIQDQTD
jgi:hypothetical protein